MQPTLPTRPTRHLTTRWALFCLLFLGFGQATAFAQVLFQYTNASSGVPAFVAANASSAGISLGTGSSPVVAAVPPCGATEGYGAQGWPTTNVFNVNTFNSEGWYVGFSITPDPGYGLKVTGMTARSRRENLSGVDDDGPIAIRYGYSVDGGVTWTTVNPGNPQSNNLCSSLGVTRIWPSWSTVNTSNPILFRVYGLSSGANLTGDLYLRDVVVNGYVCADAPELSPAPLDFLVCTGQTSYKLPYTSTNAVTYAINFDPAAEAEGFVDVLPTALPVGPDSITWTIPAGAAIGDYNAVLAITNECGFTTSYPLVITVSALPDNAFRPAGTNVTVPFTATLDFDDDHETCVGSILEYGANVPATGPNACTFVWSISGGGTILAGGTNRNVRVEWTTPGTYTLTFVATSVATGCQSTNSLEVTVNDLPTVVCPADTAVCLGSFIFLEAMSGLTPPSIDLSSSFSGPGVSPFIAELGLWDFDSDVSGTGTHTITYSYTDDNGCVNTCTFNIDVDSIPEITALDKTICSGSSTDVDVSDPSGVLGATFDWSAVYGDVTGGTGSGTGVAFGASALNETLVNPTNDPIVVTYTLTPVGPAPTDCEGIPITIDVTVMPAPKFEFNASSNSDPGGNASNESGPSSITVDFCAGDQLTLSGYDDNGSVGFIGNYVTSGNVSYDGAPLGAGPVNFTIDPSAAAGFFGNVYGGVLGYGLTGGTFGTITQEFTPYLDMNGNDAYDPGVDCLGDPITLNYHIYGPIVVNVTRNDNNLCSGENVDYSISTTSTEPLLFDLTLAANPNGANPADLTDDNVLPIELLALNLQSVNPYNFTQILNNALGTFDRGRVQISVTNVRYADTDVSCSVTVNNPQSNTIIYPKPRLAPIDDLLSCDGSTLELDANLLGLPSLNANAAGNPVRIEWSLSAPGIVEDGATGIMEIYDNAGLDPNGGVDIAQVLSLTDPLDGPKTATFTITPRASGPTNAYNGDDCFGDPITVNVTVVPAPKPEIEGSSCTYIGTEIVLSGFDYVLPPATLLTADWADDGSGHATVDLVGVVTGNSLGTSIIYFTVTDDAGCAATASHQVTVIEELVIDHVYTGGAVTCGDDFTITVEATGVCDISTIDFTFSWDPTLFQFVTHSTASIPGAFTALSTFSAGSGQLTYSLFADTNPFAIDLPDGTELFTYTLRAIGTPGLHNVPETIDAEEAYNGSFSLVPMITSGVSIEIEPISLNILGNPVACPSDGQAILLFDDVHGNPNHFFIDFDGCPGFPDDQEGVLVVAEGQIIIPFMPEFVESGSCNATLVITDTDNGCESQVYHFAIVIDQIPPTASNPAPVHVACLWQIPAPDPAVVIDEDDNCPGPLTVAYEPTLTDTSGTGCAGDPLVILRRYSVTDQAGNSTTVTQLITAEDNLPPYLSTPPTLATWYGSEAAAVAAALAHANANKQDNCSTLPQITVSQGTVPTYIGCTVTIPIVLVDACGNLTNINYTTIIDTEVPTVSSGLIDDCYDAADPGDPYGIFTFAVNAAIAATTATDDCDSNLDITATVSGTDCELTIIVTATDDCGKSASVSYVTRAENDMPNISSDPLALHGMCFETEAEAEAAAIAATFAGDDCTPPDELQFDAFVNPGCPAEVMVIVTDYCGNPAMIVYTGVHIDTQDPTVDPDPVIADCFKTLQAAYDSLAIAARADDNCTATEDLVLTTSFVQLTEAPCATYDITLTFTDNCGRSVSITFDDITIDNEAPTAEPLAGLEYNCVDEVDAPDTNLVDADDNCGVVDIVWISDDLPTSCPGTGTRTYRVYDCAGNYTDVLQSIIINDDVRPTWVTTPANHLDRTIDCDDELSILNALSLEPVAEDNCGNPSVVLESDVPLSNCSGGWIRTWRAYDDCGNSSTNVFTQTVTIVDNDAPSWVSNVGDLDLDVDCDDADGLAAALALQPVAEDNCGTVSYEMVHREYVDYGGCSYGYLGYWETEWVAKDNCDNSSLPYYQFVYIIDTVAPTWVTPQGMPYPEGLDVAVSCSDFDALAFANTLEPVAEDECPGAVTLTKSSGLFVPSGGCLGEGTITNTWTAEDQCGNLSTVFTQIITVVDNTPPTFAPICQFMPLNLFTSGGYACPASATLTGLVIGQEIDESYSWNVAGFNVPPLAGCIFDDCVPSSAIIVKVANIENVYNADNCVRTITLSFELRDPCGNVQPELFVCIYNIIDDTAPVALAGSIDDCYDTEADAISAAIAATSVSDNCTATLDLVVTATKTGSDCAATISVNFTDCAGNVSNTVNYNTRIDNEAPTMVVSVIPTCYPTNAAAQAAAIAGTTITDNCSSYGLLSITTVVSGTCPATVTVTATDECGNSNTVAYPGLCIGAGSSVMITTPAANTSSTCANQAADLAAWLANNGGAEASGSGITWTYSPDPVTFVTNCTTHTKVATVTFTATDGCGYMASTTATFSVTDNTPPTANPIANVNLSCVADTTAPDINLVTGVSDNCGGTPMVALFANTKMGTGCVGDPLIIARTYSVTDDYCNTTYITQMITVVDNTPPTFTAPANITIEVNAGCVYNTSTAVTGDVTDESDDCTASGPFLQAFYTDVVTPGVNFQELYIITRTWELFDACGNAAIPRVQTITVQDVTPPTLVGCPSNLTLTPDLFDGECGGLYGAQTNPSFDDNCDGESISYSLSGATPGTGSGFVSEFTIFAEGETVVTYTVTDAAGNTASCSFTVFVNCLSVEGRIIWEHDGVSGVKDATVRLTQGMVNHGSDLSDTNGDYNLSVPFAGMFRVTPVKNINRLNGVTSADATRITNHVNFSDPIINPYKKVCADVNRSGIINTQDATLITQCLMGNPTALAVFNVFWRFVPTDYVMPGTAHQNVPVFPEFKDVNVGTMDIVGIDFFGMKIGDVTDPWADPQIAPSIPPLVWVVKDQTLVAGQEIDLTFAATNFNDISSYQFGLDFDPTQLQFVGFQPLDALPMNLLDNFGSYQANLGDIRTVWFAANGTNLADGTQVFRAKFKVLASGKKLSQVLRLDDAEIECKAYNSAFMPTEVKLVFAESVSAETPRDLGKPQLQLLQNRPNPFTDVTTIGFILPEACEANIRILDISGRELALYSRNYSAGYHELEFRMQNAVSYGVLICELVTPQGTRTIKMMTAN